MPNNKEKTNTNFKHGMSGTRIYRIWASLLQRTGNPKYTKYDLYGGKGIKLCKRWMSFINFYEDMGKSYEYHVKKHGEYNTSIDRHNGDFDYEPSNCRWATKREQRLNCNHILMYEYNGVSLCLADWCRIVNIPYTTMLRHLTKEGKTIKDIMNLKLHPIALCNHDIKIKGNYSGCRCSKCGKFIPVGWNQPTAPRGGGEELAINELAQYLQKKDYEHFKKKGNGLTTFQLAEETIKAGYRKEPS